MNAPDFDQLPRLEAGCKMPTATHILASDGDRKRDAREGSRRLLVAYAHYYERHHG